MTREEALKVYEKQHERFDNTREIQWKFNIAMWTLVAAGIYFFGSRTVKICDCLFWILWVAFFLTHLLFIYRTQHSLQFSKEVDKFILKQLDDSDNKNIIIDFDDLTKKVKVPTAGYYWIAFQVISTLILLGLLAVVHYNK